ncbi:hypothetical protein ACFYO2_31380 [Streptomyces sp. NPDC006602]|uniref:hypothetical protein n=1 Tax=Streptomyces sp. NPDC006602 TaxID=3364751 RepID=UPI0036A0B810
MTAGTRHRLRHRLLLATALTLLALVLAGCKDGTGVRDEGPSTVSPESSPSTPAR